MIQLDIKSIFKSVPDTGIFDFSDDLYSKRCKDTLIAMVYNVDLANSKKSFAHTKDRGEVSGTTKKMYRQKGTGGARHGSARVSQFRGGGIVFGPRFSKRKISINKKSRAFAILTCLNKHIERGSLLVVNNFNTESFKTKSTLSALKSFFYTDLTSENLNIRDFLVKKGCLFIGDINADKNFLLSSRNIIGLKYLSDSHLNLRDLLFSGIICIAQDALSKIVKCLCERLDLVIL